MILRPDSAARRAIAAVVLRRHSDLTLINIALGLAVFSRARSRLPYWVA